MNALWIEETDVNFIGESVSSSELAEAGVPRSKTWAAASLMAGHSVFDRSLDF